MYYKQLISLYSFSLSSWSFYLKYAFFLLCLFVEIKTIHVILFLVCRLVKHVTKSFVQILFFVYKIKSSTIYLIKYYDKINYIRLSRVHDYNFIYNLVIQYGELIILASIKHCKLELEQNNGAVASSVNEPAN